MKHILLTLMVFGSFGAFASFDPFKDITPLEKLQFCSVTSKAEWSQYCYKERSAYNDTIEDCLKYGTLSQCAETFSSMKFFEPACNLCNTSPSPSYKSRQGNGSDDDAEEYEDELEDDSWFDEGTPQCDEGTYYEENGYC